MRECEKAEQRVDRSFREQVAVGGRGVEEGVLLGTENLFHKFLRTDGFYLITRNPSIIQLELNSVYMDFLRPTKSLEKEKDRKKIGV